MKSLRGGLEGVCHGGYVEGWAFDMRRPLHTLAVVVIDHRRREVARGLAGLYRKDLAYEGLGAGWCGLRLRLRDAPARLAWKRMTLALAKSRQRICSIESIPYLFTDTVREEGIAGLMGEDPTLIHSVDQLRGCEEVFTAYVRAHGVEAFVRGVYRYLLSRPVDALGLTSAMKHLRTGSLSPFGLVQTIADSEEYRSRPRQHCAPTMAAFPLRME